MPQKGHAVLRTCANGNRETDSALDIGLWDIRGKAAGKIHDPDPLANRQRVEAVKKGLGPGVRMMVDVNQKLDVLGNIRQAAVLEDLDLVWYEEPVLADDLAACAEVAASIKIPVATGENNYTRYEFRELIERRAARYLMPDVCRANGYSETLKIGHLAAAHQVAVSPHVVYELSIQVCGTLANGFLVELMDWMPPDLFEDIPRCVDGEIRIPDRPGHGMTLARGGWRSIGARRQPSEAAIGRQRASCAIQRPSSARTEFPIWRPPRAAYRQPILILGLRYAVVLCGQRRIFRGIQCSRS